MVRASKRYGSCVGSCVGRDGIGIGIGLIQAWRKVVESKVDHKVDQRKKDHLELFRSGGVSARKATTWLEHVHLLHDALPELGTSEIDTSVEFCGRGFKSPLFITGMTGGTNEAGTINRELARVAQELKIGFGLGSGRAMLEHDELTETYMVRDTAPDVFLAWNLGGVQLLHTGMDRILSAMDRLKADALCIHLNPAQELVQPEGDRDFRGVMDGIGNIIKSLDRPIIVKETGAGISKKVASMLSDVGVEWLDVSGCGGTSWPGVEILRSCQEHEPNAQALWDWGIPTAAAVLESKGAVRGIIASGGIRTGLDAVRALVLGANMVGLASPVIQAWFSKGEQGAMDYLCRVRDGVINTMLLAGCKNIMQLHNAPRVTTGPLLQWIQQRNLG